MFGFSGNLPGFSPEPIWTVTVSGKIMASVPPGDVRPLLSASQLQTRICTSRAPRRHHLSERHELDLQIAAEE